MPIMDSACLTLITVKAGTYSVEGSVYFEFAGERRSMHVRLDLPIDGAPEDISAAWYRIGAGLAEQVEARLNAGAHVPVEGRPKD